MTHRDPSPTSSPPASSPPAPSAVPSSSPSSAHRRLRPTETAEPLSPEIEHLLLEALRGIRYGQVLLIVQDGKVVQIDRTEKVRIAHQ
jgi:hypothetical protein